MSPQPAAWFQLFLMTTIVCCRGGWWWWWWLLLLLQSQFIRVVPIAWNDCIAKINVHAYVSILFFFLFGKSVGILLFFLCYHLVHVVGYVSELIRKSFPALKLRKLFETNPILNISQKNAKNWSWILLIFYNCSSFKLHWNDVFF